jgi:hypothetical protein
MRRDIAAAREILDSIEEHLDHGATVNRDAADTVFGAHESLDELLADLDTGMLI